jgi:GxxExxY protein
VYNELAGFPEFVLRRAMTIAILEVGFSAAEEVPLPVWFRGRQIVKSKADLIVQSCVIVEINARTEVDPFNRAQVLHYLKATDLEVGLLLNFGRRPEFSRVIYENAEKSESDRGSRCRLPAALRNCKISARSASPEERRLRSASREAPRPIRVIRVP